MSDHFLVKHPFLTKRNMHQVLGQLPLILNAFERACLLKDINTQLFKSEVCPEFLLWAISGAGLGAPRRDYEVLETVSGAGHSDWINDLNIFQIMWIAAVREAGISPDTLCQITGVEDQSIYHLHKDFKEYV